MAIIVPPPTKEYLTLVGSPFTAHGSPTITSDQHGSDNTYLFDGVNDYLQSSEKLLPTGVLNNTLSFWVYLDSSDDGNPVIISQYDTNPNRMFVMTYITSITTLVCAWNSSVVGSNFLNARMANPPLDTWFHVITSVDGVANNSSSVLVYLNGVDVTTSGAKNLLGFDGGGGSHNLKVGAQNSSPVSSFLQGIPSRIKGWSNIILTPEEAAKEYSNEFASIISSGFTPEQINRAHYILGSSPRVEV